MRATIAAAILGLAMLDAAGTVQAQTEAGPVRIEHAWARAAAAGRIAAVYLTIRTTGAPDRLVGLESPVAGSAGVHESTLDGGVMRMRPVATLPVTAAQPIVFAPSGYHIMLEDLRQALTVGERFPLTLRFEHAGALTVSVAVQKAGAMGPPAGGDGMGGMKMP